MPIVCTDCEEKDERIYHLKEVISDFDTVLKKVKPILGAATASAGTHELREARRKVYEELEQLLSDYRSMT